MYIPRHFLHFRRLAQWTCVLLLLLTQTAAAQPRAAAGSRQPASLAGGLTLSPEDITAVEFGFRGEYLGSVEINRNVYALRLQNGVFTDGQHQLPPAALNPLLNTLRYMLPGTHPLTWYAWTDDYPNAWVTLILKDGRQVKLLSNSQFQGMLPWNVQVWATQMSFRPKQTFTLLNPDIINDLNTLWRSVGEQGFPRFLEDRSLTEMVGDPLPETVKFYVQWERDPFFDWANKAPILGLSSASLAAFVPLAQKDPEIKTLLDGGYRLYDAALSMEVRLTDMLPVQYAGTLVLVSPDGGDAVPGQVIMPTAAGERTTSTFIASEVIKQVAARREVLFLRQAAQLLQPLTFLNETRQEIEQPAFACPENTGGLDQAGAPIQAIWETSNPRLVTFYPLANGRWTVDFGLQRKDGVWTDALARRILQAWFPEPFASLPAADLQAIYTAWRLEFQPGVTLRQPDLLANLKQGQPEQLRAHPQNAQKSGDFGFLGFAGRLSIGDDGSAPQLLYCGKELPSYYPGPYDVAGVRAPDETAARKGTYLTADPSYPWLPLSGLLPWGDHGIFSADLAFSQPGFLHVIWTEEGKGVYYSDGWVDGSGWLEKQRLGETAFAVMVRAFPDGEVHLFWDAGLTTGGLIHLWKPAGGTWRTPEHWPEMEYIRAMVRDSQGVLHLGDFESDGLDVEFMHRTWSASAGLSAPENISRHTGDVGLAEAYLRLDGQGNLHAAWAHILNPQDTPDFITGETSDLSGVFYAVRDGNGSWSAPELVGVQAAYSHELGFELDGDGQALMTWQAAEGLVSRFRKNGEWEKTRLAAVIAPPDAPADFGPGREVQQTAQLATAVDPRGKILLGWLVPGSGIRLAAWTGTGWAKAVEILTPEMSKRLSADTPFLQMAVDAQGTVTFVFFQGDAGVRTAPVRELTIASYNGVETSAWPLGIFYSQYGIPEARLVLDSVGSAAVMGLPRSPQFAVKIPPDDVVIHGNAPDGAPTGTPTGTPSPTPTQTPTRAPGGAPLPAPTRTQTAAPQPTAVRSPTAAGAPAVVPAAAAGGANGFTAVILGVLLVLLLGLLGQAWKRGRARE